MLRAPSLGTLEDVVDTGQGPEDEPDPETLGRYQIVGRLGQGAMGVVYEAIDPRSKTPLAIKSVSRLSPEALYRFKQEFRALVRFEHPNVVSLYELHLSGGRLFFTMELVQGSDFVTALCGPRLGPNNPRRRPCRDYGLLRDALRQLATGVHAIHREGILHRDIKPSNVLITPEGRVVLLDFGLVRQHDVDVDLGVTDDGAVLGTPLYMSPEQAMGDRLGPPSDWYGVGEMLYQALTGQTPFQGKGMLALLAAKQDDRPPAPSSVVAGLPPALESLCVDLLEREPAARPTGEQVLARIDTAEIGDGSSDGIVVPRTASVSNASPFLGRDAEVQALHEAAITTSRGRPVVVLVDGMSGMGKTALVERFIAETSADPRTVVLSGKCSERESIPYKALDSVMDTLCVHLRGLGNAAEVMGLLPRDPRAVARLFPVLLSVPSVAESPERDDTGLDPAQARRRAFAALRELWGRIADRHRLIIHIDDLQWTDLDSAVLLDAILRDADAPPLLLVGTYRTGSDRDAGPLARLVQELGEDDRVSLSRIHVGPMSRTEAANLALCMLGDRSKKHRSLAEEVAREAEGSPFFVGELVRYARRVAQEAEIPVTDSGSSVSLDSVIRHRLAALSQPARRLLEVIAAAGGRVSQGIALRVAAGDDSSRELLSRLRAESLVRLQGPRDQDPVEIYHDRIRETALRSIESGQLAEIHLALGRALEASGDADAVALSHHFRQAGEDQRATRHTLDAASQAEEALAFDRAAELYRAALELQAVPAEDVPGLQARLADALANAGRLYDAAKAYLRASNDGQDREKLEWTRRAAEHLLSSGHSEEGRVVLQTVLDAVGMS
nr:protein kinase [Deltaproteobacteria bacterium]